MKVVARGFPVDRYIPKGHRDYAAAAAVVRSLPAVDTCPKDSPFTAVLDNFDPEIFA